MFSDASLRLRCRTCWRLSDPRMFEGIGGVLDELEEKRRLSSEVVNELVATLSRPLLSEVDTDVASASRVASSGALDVLGLIWSPIAESLRSRCLGLECSKNKS